MRWCSLLLTWVLGALPAKGTDWLAPGETRQTPLGVAFPSPVARATWEVHPTRAAGAATEAPLRFALVRPPGSGDVLELRFELSSLDPGSAPAMIAVHLGGESRTGGRFAQAIAGTNWVPHVRFWTLSAPDLAATSHLGFYPYGAATPFAVRAVQLVNHGPHPDPAAVAPTRGLSYPGQEPDAPWRAEAAARIAQHRMADLTVHLVDRAGHPVSDARIQVQQLRHAYAFGTAVVAARLVDQDIRPYVQRSDFDFAAWQADNVRYRAILTEMFNTAVTENDLKWPHWLGQPPRYQRKVTLAALHWLQERGFAIRGHTLLWLHPQHVPEHVRADLRNWDRLDAHVRAHFADIGAATAPLVREWDLFNEPVHSPIWKELPPALPGAWARAAHEATGGARLFVNDFNIVGEGAVRVGTVRDYHAIIRRLLENEAPLGGIGFQAHFWSEIVTPPARLWEVLDDFARYGLPLRATEFDFTCPDDAYHAQYLGDFLTAWFAHPATDGFLMWGFWARAHWRPAAALFLADWTPRPAAAVWRDLVLRQWWTDLESSPGETVRAFLGHHRVRAVAPDGRTIARTIELDRAGASLVLTLP